MAGALAGSSEKGAFKYRSMDILLAMAGTASLMGLSFMAICGRCRASRPRLSFSVDPNRCNDKAESGNLLSLMMNCGELTDLTSADVFGDRGTTFSSCDIRYLSRRIHLCLQ
jgi:hypothetical protein